MKLNKVQQRQLGEFTAVMDESGCVSVSDWALDNRFGGSPSKKAVPSFVSRHEKGKTTDERALAYFGKHPKRKAVLVLDAELLTS